MKKSSIPLIGGLFCDNCDMFNSYKCISKTLQLGEKKLQTKYGTQTLHRYEKLLRCKKCNNEKIKIVYE